MLKIIFDAWSIVVLRLKNIIKRHLSNVSYEKTAYFNGFLNDCLPETNIKEKFLKIGIIADSYIFDGLDYEAHLYPLTMKNYAIILKNVDLDFILVTSFIESSLGDWQFTNLQIFLDTVVKEAKSNKIPTIFWLTKGSRYFDRYLDFAKNFDHIYCSDTVTQTDFQALQIKAGLLQPCVQPLIFNPLRTSGSKQQYDFISDYALFDGWADIDRFEKHYQEILDNELLEQLRIIESRCLITKNRVQGLSRYTASTLGSVLLSQKVHLLRNCKIFVLGEKSILDEVDQAWLLLQGMASHVPTLILTEDNTSTFDHNYRSVFKGNSGKLKRLIDLFKQDELLWHRYGHLAWREALQFHTFSHRLNQIADDLNLNEKKRPIPLISLITPSRRLENIELIIRNFERQTWPNKELILVANIDRLPNGFEKPQQVRYMCKIPQNCFAGEALSEGIVNAMGKYIFRIDDDDEYGENYCLDMILAAEAWNLDFFGKPRSMFYAFENECKVFCLSSNVFSSYKFLSFREKDKVGIESGVSGNSFGGKKLFFEENKFIPENYSAADIFFQDNLAFSDVRIARLDIFNCLVKRRNDQSTHTWKINAKDFISAAEIKGKVFFHSDSAFV